MAWTSPKTWAAGEFVDAAEMNAHLRDNLNYINDLRIKYVQRTTDFTGITNLQSTVLTAPAFTPISSTRLLRITARWRSISSSVVDDIYALRINESGVGQVNEVNIGNTSGSGKGGGVCTTLVISPSVAAHTYTLAADRIAGTGTGNIQGSGTYPIQLWVEDVGAS